MVRFVVMLAAALLVVGLTAPASAASADKRVALVIGNAAYEHTPKLDNPVHDATAVAELFRKAGFEVVLAQTDVGNLEFKRALRNFLLSAQDSEIAVLFYSGHGIQIGDQNYMVPIDAKLAREYDAKDEAISLERIVEALEPAKRLRLVILDACRDNPFVVNMKQRVATRSISRGLAPVGPTGVDTLIAYAAKAGSTASDGGDGHSPYTKALLKHLAEPGLDIRLAFGRIRDDVLRQTGYEQEPFVYGSLGGSVISLVPAPTIAKEAPAADIAADYNLVEKINSKMAWEVFINTHKTGIVVDLARKRLQLLEQQELKLASLPPPNAPAKPSAAEIRAWTKVKDSRDRNAISNFIKTYETSPFAAKAREALEELNRIERENEQKALAEREAARQREEAERQRLEREAAALKAAKEEAERKRLERQRQAEAEAERKRQAEAERLKLEREAQLAKAAREKAEADRRKAEQETALAKAAEAEAERKRQAEADRKKAELEAALAKAAREKAEADRQKAEREAQLAKAAEAEAERKRQAEAKRLEAERQAALVKEAEHKRHEEACAREQKVIARLEASITEASARQELDQLTRTLSCEDLRPSLLALSTVALRLKELEARQAADQIRTAQRELRRIGCYSGADDGLLNKATKDAIQLYRTKSKQKAEGLSITEDLLKDLKAAPVDRCAEVAKVQQARPEKGKHTTPRQESEEPRTQAKVGRPSAPGVMTGVGF